ncbi:tRNA delta(2)-isopentenylpyrophosphate transferase [Roseomonas mucosa]|uniref:tRNA dimethylallyltransferase n=2 Tax=Roseomonadaceae TaxID=3385906 RepID=A0A1S8DC12_9PROT|nr:MULTISPECIES: tRNA (adenosine(37)-N6)-dimethylallyltransferase MiaA [Roseomonas]MDT8274681.1 tRNA (adenosine(37)-N6)-dimethylallyltransferase MiaA [Roseomonas mucosa]ONH85274.1 tRNA (adenosine(37)-N6)-dimethylallyltransferase MiaA [Roseomonas mucosa]UZO96753.1 tRNA delta(2)-isopentenylpyrophosphate transferase [Roseomonas mucosa]
MRQPPLLLIAGPTASGKSALALAIARQVGGAVLNADSMQVYRDLRILTARPAPEEEAQAPHRLYGIRDAAEAASAAWWRGEAERAIAEVAAAGLVPILCGGTGLYFQALLRGLAPVPRVPEAAREEARALLAELGPEALHGRLAAADPDTAARLRPGDSQRIARAWEVWRGTGRGLAAWQAVPIPDPPPERPVLPVLLDPPREELREAIRRRWSTMLDLGAMEEVRALLARGLDPALPAMRAHGVPELGGVLRGEMSMEEAGRRACLAIGQYTKRQATWFRHHDLAMPAGRGADPSVPHTIRARFTGSAQFSESLQTQIISFVDSAR